MPSKLQEHLQPIEQTQMARRVYEATRDLIIKGEIEEGQRITETYLSELFQVSRSPIREALKMLSFDGFIELLPYRGARVSLIKPKNVKDHYQLKAMLDGYCTFSASLTLSPQDLDYLRKIMDSMELHVQDGDFDKIAQSNTKFHEFIVESSDNELISQYYSSLSHNLRRYADLSLGDSERWGGVLLEHEAIFDALKRKDELAAFKAANDHAHNAMERVMKIIDPLADK